MPDRRGPKVGRLSDLVRNGQYIQITCERRECQHSGRLEPEDLITRFGDVALEAINQAALCSKCKGRGFHLQGLQKITPGHPDYEPY